MAYWYTGSAFFQIPQSYLNYTPINRFHPHYIPGQWVGKGGNVTVGEFGLLFDQIPT